MRSDDPYKLLNINPEASPGEIEAAYDRLFDLYEARAQSGEDQAIEMLDRLNNAHDRLLNLKHGTTVVAPIRQTQRAATSKQAALHRYMPGDRITVRRRAGSPPRSTYARPARSSAPYILLAALTLLLLASLAYLLTRGADLPTEPPKGNILATVNGVPIYEREFNERVAKDRETALSDPFMSGFLNNFQGITGTRALDVLKYDALDKLINLEVIQQQARKENRYPGPEQQAQLISEAKARELKGEAFGAFLTRLGISEPQYNARVIENFVYVVMAEAHMPKTGDSTARTEGFIRWMCDTRKNYDAVVKLSFTVAENQPCTSGLPTDVPLPGVTEGGTPVPEPIATAEKPTK